jgi:hypothetical protein
MKEKRMGMVERKSALCGVCPGGCAIIATVKDERLIAVEPDKVVPGAVELNVGGGKPIQIESWRNCNANILTDFNNRDPIFGFPVFKALLCEIERA